MKIIYKVLIIVLIVLMAAGGVAAYLYFNKKIDLELVGEKEITINLLEEYVELGAKAKINKIDISDDIVVKGSVDNRKVGSYELVYSVKSKYVKNDARISRTVNVVDNVEPKIELKGKNKISIYVDGKYEEPGFTASDNYDGDLTDKVVTSGTFDNTKIGEYVLNYSVKDTSGNEFSVDRTISVIKKPEPAPVNPNGTGTGLPIIMYHYFYDGNVTDGSNLNSNYLEIHAFEEQLKYLKDNGYNFPTWTEVADFVDGKITLPRKSVVLTVDDGEGSLFDLAIPVIEKYQVPVTSFIITAYQGGITFQNHRSKYVNYQSHTHNMHRGGCSGGHGGIFRCISYEEGLADLNKSISILGSGDALAYPFGDVTSSTLQIVKNSPFKVAVTTKSGKSRKGMDRYQLPRVRMSKGMALSTFINYL